MVKEPTTGQDPDTTLTDEVLMPGADYQAICNAVRALTGGTAALKSGDIAPALAGVSGGGLLHGTVTPSETGLSVTIPTGSACNNLVLRKHTFAVETNAEFLSLWATSPDGCICATRANSSASGGTSGGTLAQITVNFTDTQVAVSTIAAAYMGNFIAGVTYDWWAWSEEAQE